MRLLKKIQQPEEKGRLGKETRSEYDAARRRGDMQMGKSYSKDYDRTAGANLTGRERRAIVAGDKYTGCAIKSGIGTHFPPGIYVSNIYCSGRSI